MKASNPSKAQKNNEQWLSTFDDFCVHLSENEFSHESWFRTQQKQAKDGTLLDERSERLENALGDDWSRLNITGLKNLIRYGDTPYQQALFTSGVEELDTITKESQDMVSM